MSGLPGLRGIDHIGFNVPNLDDAEAFLTTVLGAVHVYTLGAKRADDNWMSEHLGVHPATVIREIRFYRLGNGANLEVFEYQAADDQAPPPKNSDLGGHHFALYVDDMEQAVAHLRAHGVTPMGGPVRSAGASEGQTWMYFRAPWGTQFELVSFPDGKAYEQDADLLLWHPAHPAE